ncbi:hypothetical protein BDN72DRAFT_617409 [Pluteus cervinus]|uniref:Uncharacterized protein n=1 Tax=Pluteus cervinus TaxID=181527 RepID=A0ACD3A179_9AGAR|nr:hypothetical protein BDN72DRAFT_617409 [Pluteus cervinus]
MDLFRLGVPINSLSSFSAQSSFCYRTSLTQLDRHITQLFRWFVSHTWPPSQPSRPVYYGPRLCMFKLQEAPPHTPSPISKPKFPPLRFTNLFAIIRRSVQNLHLFSVCFTPRVIIVYGFKYSASFVQACLIRRQLPVALFETRFGSWRMLDISVDTV